MTIAMKVYATTRLPIQSDPYSPLSSLIASKVSEKLFMASPKYKPIADIENTPYDGRWSFEKILSAAKRAVL